MCAHQSHFKFTFNLPIGYSFSFPFANHFNKQHSGVLGLAVTSFFWEINNSLLRLYSFMGQQLHQSGHESRVKSQRALALCF